MDARRHGTGYKQTNRTQPAAELRPAMIRRHGRKQSADYFCQVRFLWRLARSFLRRLCLLIFALRRFFSEPIGFFGARSIYDFV